MCVCVDDSYSLDLRLAKVHLRMRCHELLHDTLLLLLFARRQTSSFLSLIVHHLLDNTSSITIQIGEFRVLWLHLGRVDCWMTCDKTIPPLHLVGLLERNDDSSLIEYPVGFRGIHLGKELAIDDGLFSFHTHDEMSTGNVDVQLASTSTRQHRHLHFEIGQGLSPRITRTTATVAGVRGLSFALRVRRFILTVSRLRFRISLCPGRIWHGLSSVVLHLLLLLLIALDFFDAKIGLLLNSGR
mmetsp:Transcript_1025/g.3170  ORF Transcript_1025/g.3170 Transcript_1025/m.3170 type:complete len:242 (+) Transcript_1025:1518-2243(+)